MLSCDNLPANGKTSARIVTRLAEMRDKALGAYIAHAVAFPSTMIDRIVPATTDADREAVYRDTGFADAWPVVTEAFTQWVIEDRFSGGRPAFERAGAQLVKDVAPFELMKLRMLNGAHSTLAYLGYLAGYDYVSEAIACPAFRTLIHRLISEEAMQTLPMGLGDLNAYRDALLERFANPALRHRTWQIAMDGSQKLPQRLLGTIRDRLAEGRSITLCALGVAAWMRYVSGIDENGGEIDVRDPLAGRLRSIWAATDGGADRIVAGFLELGEVFGKDLPENQDFRSTLSSHLRSLQHHGALATARRAIGV